LKTLLCFLLLTLCLACSQLLHRSEKIRVVHYNIFELDSRKLKKLTPQLLAAKEVLAPLAFDFISINEIQYDLPGVPNESFKSTGQNLSQLMSFLKPQQSWFTSFYPANTGLKARRKANGEYTNSSGPKARSYADQMNYGLFPAQYSSGLASIRPVKKSLVINKLKWIDFNEALDLGAFKTAKGERLPRSLELFDKNFVDTVIEVAEQEIHFITLHTVPAYHFGNKATPNYQRNRDQLAFLEWYLDSSVSSKEMKLTQRLAKRGISPLPKGAHFIAMGDWNTDINGNNPGSFILRRLFESMGAPIPTHVTHESAGLKLKPFTMQLDYILSSPSLISLNQRVIRSRPASLKEGCTPEQLKESECLTSASAEYKAQKTASDHFALWAEFKFRRK